MDKKRITMKKKIKFKKKRNISYKTLNNSNGRMMKGGISEEDEKNSGKNIVIIAKKNEQGGGFKEIKYGEIDDTTFSEILLKANIPLETGKANAQLNASTTDPIL